MRIFTTKGPHAINFCNRIFHFKDHEANGHVITYCDSKDDYLSQQFVDNFDGYTDECPVHLNGGEKPDMTPVLIGSLDKGVTINNHDYHFKPDKNYPFMTCSIPVHDAAILINISPDNFWVANDPEKALFAKRKIKEIRTKQREIDKIKFTLKNIALMEAQNKRLIEKDDNRNLGEVLSDIYVSDAKSHGLDYTDEYPLHKEKSAPKKAESKHRDIEIPKIQEIIDNKTKTIVNKSQTLDKMRRLVTPDDLPSLKKDIEKVKVDERIIDPGELNFNDFMKDLKEKMYGIEDLNIILERELDNKNRKTIVQTLNREIRKLKGMIIDDNSTGD